MEIFVWHIFGHLYVKVSQAELPEIVACVQMNIKYKFYGKHSGLG